MMTIKPDFIWVYMDCFSSIDMPPLDELESELELAKAVLIFSYPDHNNGKEFSGVTQHFPFTSVL